MLFATANRVRLRSFETLQNQFVEKECAEAIAKQRNLGAAIAKKEMSSIDDARVAPKP
jgi:hypothetical protein